MSEWNSFWAESHRVLSLDSWNKGLTTYRLMHQVAMDSMEFRMKQNAEIYLKYAQTITEDNIVAPYPEKHFQPQDFCTWSLGPQNPWRRV